MSIIVASGEAISKNILNSSRSKQMYSFSKTKRFYNSDSIGSATFYYNLPSVKSKRATSIGYGSKSDFTKERNTNPPFYNLERLFEGKKKGEAPAYTIGLGREYFKKTVVNNTLSEPQYISPGPGKYNKMVEFGSDSPKYTIPKKSNRVTCLNKLGRTPGPGQYSCVNILGKYYDSRLKNAPMIGWGLSKSPRFIKHCKRYIILCYVIN